VNEKPKLFFQKLETVYQPNVIGAKVLLYSRNVEIDKIAEILGGKEQKHSDLFSQYLERQDYNSNDIE